MTKRTIRLVGRKTGAEPFRLPEKDADLHAAIIGGYTNQRRSLRHAAKTIGRDLAVIHDMLTFAGKAPWFWCEEDFESWCADLGRRRKLAMSSQRHYQSTIRGFLDYVVKNLRFPAEISRLYGIRVRQICTADNCIPHVVERELAGERPALSHHDVDTFFSAIDEEIEMCARFRGKALRPLQRDKVMFGLVYSCGLRASEALGLDVTSFRPNPRCPELGDHGFVSVWGKGSKGSGPRHREVPIVEPSLPSLIDWYIEFVRPQFALKADPNETALFLSERGRRLCLSGFEARFQHIVSLSGLAGKGYSPHCLRHSSVSHKNLHLSLEANRIMHGHRYAATTQGYMHIPDEDVDREMRRTVKAITKLLGEQHD
jgi:site-specific recombinase XerD